MLRSIYASLFASATIFAVTVAACSSDRSAFDDDHAPPFTSADSSVPDAEACGFRCSRDLKRVLKGCGTEEDEVVAECPVGQGCGIDKCVSACAAAAMSKGSVGCSFWTMPADDGKYGAGACFAAMIANTSDTPVSVTADYGNAPIDISKSVYTVTRTGVDEPVYTLVDGPLAPGQVAVVFLAQADEPADQDASLCPNGVVPAL